MTKLIILLGKIVSWMSKRLNLGAGITWSGEIALMLDPHIFPKLIPGGTKLVLIAGTNGKTTTSKMIRTVLEENPTLQIIHNDTGANLINGMVGSIITKANLFGKVSADYIILETDEATLPIIAAQVKPDIIVLLNLFRDQLDRYGEVDTIATKWQQAIKSLPGTAKIINGDDPHLAWIGKNSSHAIFFGLDETKFYQKTMEHATDSIYCPHCGARLDYSGSYFSHLGKWRCPKCRFTTPKLSVKSQDFDSPLKGTYNRYNTLAAVTVCRQLGLSDEKIKHSLKSFSPSFGRLEKINYRGRAVTVLLSKNPTGFNESLRIILSDRGDNNLLLVLNDRIPDGRDVSWIWDVDFEQLGNTDKPIHVAGDRVFDLALRLKYAGVRTSLIQAQANLDKALESAVKETAGDGNLWILATYSAMLDVRKILTGKKIL